MKSKYGEFEGFSIATAAGPKSDIGVLYLPVAEEARAQYREVPLFRFKTREAAIKNSEREARVSRGSTEYVHVRLVDGRWIRE